MARYLGPKNKLKKRFGLIKDEKPKSGKPKRKSVYGMHLEEKQKLKFIYGILENQFKRYIEEAKKHDRADLYLLQKLETRLDNVIYRLGFAKTREQARQLISHRHVSVDGKKVNRPSYSVKPDETISLSDKLYNNRNVLEAIEENKKIEFPSWLLREDFSGKVINIPKEDDLRKDINITYVLEFYSR